METKQAKDLQPGDRFQRKGWSWKNWRTCSKNVPDDFFKDHVTIIGPRGGHTWIWGFEEVFVKVGK